MQQWRGRLAHVHASSLFSLHCFEAAKAGWGFEIFLVGFAQLLCLILDMGVCRR